MDVFLFSFLAASCLAVIFYFPKILNSYKKTKLIDKIPGPTKWPIIGTLLPYLLVPRHDRFNVSIELIKQYEKKKLGFFRMWIGSLPEIRIFRCEHAEKIFKSSKHIEKSPTYKLIEGWLGNGLITSTGPHWFSHRRLLTPAFHYSILEDFSEIFGENSSSLVEQLSNEIKADQQFDVYPYVTKTALDIICETAMGLKLRSLPDNEYVKAVYSFSEISMNRFFKPWLVYDSIFNRSKRASEYYKAVDVLQNMTKNVIKERKHVRASSGGIKQSTNDAGIKTKKMFLDLLLDVANENEFFCEQDIIDEVNTFMFAGHDTTSVGICWALYMIGHHPEVQEKIYQEMEEIFGDDKSRIATYKDLSDMKYLERVIKETLRIRPSVPVISRKLNEEIEIEGYKIPADTFVSLQIYFIHRDERYFKDPEKFDPDRFLPENMEGRHSYAFVPFSAGPRNCIGQRFALLEEKSMISSIVRNFKIQSMDKSEKIHLIQELVLRPHEGIQIKLQKRH